jgi:hypothetical protein
MSIRPDTKSVGVGAFSFDVEIARAWGWTDEECNTAIAAMTLLSRGANDTHAIIAHRKCEACSRDLGHDVDCTMCRGKLVPSR